ncbi:MAG: polysaccharide biosynthesis/export family protein [bacterium]
MRNKFLIALSIIHIIIIHSVYAQEIPSFNTSKIFTEITQSEYLSRALLEVTPILPGSFTSHSKVSFKISNVGPVNIPSSIFQVNLIDPDNKVIWEGVKSFGQLSPTQEIVFKFRIALKEIKFGIYQLRYILIYANKEFDNKIEIPAAVSANLTFDKPLYRIKECIKMNLELVNTGRFYGDLVVTTTIPDIQFTSQKKVSLYPKDKITIPYSLNIPPTVEVGTHTVKVDLKAGNLISNSFDFVITQSEPLVEKDYTIGPLDVLEIFVIEDPDLRKTVTVAPDGKISFPLMGNVYVAGMTSTEVSEKIASFLSKDYLVNPHVTVSILQISSKKFSIVGEVERPGVFPVNEGVNLLKAIALAGGFTKFADLRKVKILREKDGQCEIIQIDVNKIIKKGEIQQNITIQPEDIIIVPASLF